MICRLFGHSTIPFRKHGLEVGRLAGIHIWGAYCVRCKREVKAHG